MWFSMFLIAIFVSNILQGNGSAFYVDFEHPNITYVNPNYYSYVNITAQRRSRRDPVHYISVHGVCLTDIGNDTFVDLYIYEFLSNEYRRSFLEYHFNFCEELQKENVFTPHIIKFLPFKACPFPKGKYHLVNISLPEMPLLKTFPFKKGRLFIKSRNLLSNQRTIEGYMDLEIKEKAQRGKYMKSHLPG